MELAMGLARDFFYLAAFLAGAGAGCFLSAYGRKTPLRSRGAWFTAGFLFFSFCAASLAASVIVSAGGIFLTGVFLVPAAAAFVFGAAVLRFPRAGVALFVAAGLCVVFAAVVFLRYPALPSQNGMAFLTVKPSNAAVTVNAGEEGDALSAALPEKSLDFEGASVKADMRYPVFGGETRGRFTRIAGDGKALRENRFVSGGPGFAVSRHAAAIPAEALLPGMRYAVVLEESGIAVSEAEGTPYYLRFKTASLSN